MMPKFENLVVVSFDSLEEQKLFWEHISYDYFFAQIAERDFSFQSFRQGSLAIKGPEECLKYFRHLEGLLSCNEISNSQFDMLFNMLLSNDHATVEMAITLLDTNFNTENYGPEN